MSSVDTGLVALEGRLQQRRHDCISRCGSGSRASQAVAHPSHSARGSPDTHRVFVAIDSW